MRVASRRLGAFDLCEVGENAVHETATRGRGIFLGQLDGLIQDDCRWRVWMGSQLVETLAQDLEVHRSDAIETPIQSGAFDCFVEIGHRLEYCFDNLSSSGGDRLEIEGGWARFRLV